MNYSGRIEICDDGSAKAFLDFRPENADPAQLCELFALFTLRLLSNLQGRAQGVLIGVDCKKSLKELSESHRTAESPALSRRRVRRYFSFSCTLDSRQAPRAEVDARGFGLLAKGVGDAARSAVTELRIALSEAIDEPDFLRRFEKACDRLGEIGISGVVSMTNQVQLARAVILAEFGATSGSATGSAKPEPTSTTQAPPKPIVAVQAALRAHRHSFAESVGIASLGETEDTGLRSLQVNAITNFVGRWINNEALKQQVTDAMRSVVHDGNPQTCTALNLQFSDLASSQQDAECAIASRCFEDFGKETDQAQRFMHELLFLRFRTVQTAAEFLGDTELQNAMSEYLVDADATLARYRDYGDQDIKRATSVPAEMLVKDDGSAAEFTDSLHLELCYVEGDAFGQSMTHLTQYIEPLERRKIEVLTEYRQVAPALAALEAEELWELVRRLSPTAKKDKSDLVRASAMLLVNVMIGEIMKREDMPRRKRMETIKRAQAMYVEKFKTDRITIDFGATILKMSGVQAEGLPPSGS